MRPRPFTTAFYAGVLILAGAVLVVKGGELIAFARAESALRAYFTAEERDDRSSLGTVESMRERVGGWVDTRILRPRARQYAIAIAPRNAASASEPLSRIDSYLSVQPTDASYWLRRGELALASGAQPDAVRRAFGLASVLAPNEAGVKLERVMFGVRLWELMNAKERERIIFDLVAIRSRLGGARLDALRRALAVKDESTKQQMRALLQQSGQGNARWATRLGL